MSGGQLPSFEGAGSQRANLVAVFFRLVVTGHLRKPQRRDAAFELPKVRSWNSQSFMTKGAHNTLFLCLSNPVSLKILKACCTVYSWNPRHLVSNSYEVLVSQDRWPEPKHCGCRFCIAGMGAICLSDLFGNGNFGNMKCWLPGSSGWKQYRGDL